MKIGDFLNVFNDAEMPTSVTILGKCYPVKIVAPGGFPKANLDGYISYENQEILIDRNLPLIRQKSVLLHEIAHGILEFFEIWDGVDDAARERICTAFARALPMITIGD